MGIYLRKSIRVGPLRFNLSKSGVGVSAGVKGLRFGTGPRGNYVHMGRDGLYYRKTFTGNREPGKKDNFEEEVVVPNHSKTHMPLEEIESGDITLMVDSSSTQLLEELHTKRNKVRLWPIVAICSAIIFLILVYNSAPGWLILLCVLGGIALTFLARLKDEMEKTVVLFYEFDEIMEKAYEGLHEAASILSGCDKAWHIEAKGDVIDRKYHAGASQLMRRKPIRIERSQPPYVKTNIETIAIPVGKQTLHLFPDRVLVYDNNGVGAVSYRNLSIDAKPTRFIEEERVPSDARVVDYTWRYVNKNGGPDKRFKDNPQLPICLYDEIDFTSDTGLNERIHVSKAEVSDSLSNMIAKLASVIPAELPSSSGDWNGIG